MTRHSATHRPLSYRLFLIALSVLLLLIGMGLLFHKPDVQTARAVLRLDAAQELTGPLARREKLTLLTALQQDTMWQRAVRVSRQNVYLLPVNKVMQRLQEVPSDKADAFLPRLQVHTFLLPTSMQQQEWQLRTLGDGQFALLAINGKQIAVGQAGKMLQGMAQTLSDTKKGSFQIKLKAVPPIAGLTYRIVPIAKAELIRKARSQFRLHTEQLPSDSLLVTLSLSLPDGELARKLLHQLIRLSLQHEDARHHSQQDQALARFKQMVDARREAVSKIQQQLEQFFTAHEALDPENRMQALFAQQLHIEQLMLDVQIRLGQQALIYTDQHPAITALREEMALLESKHAAIREAMRDLPLQHHTLTTLRQELTLAIAMYETAMREHARLQFHISQEPRSMFVIQAAHILSATPANPLAPWLLTGGLLLLISALLSSLRTRHSPVTARTLPQGTKGKIFAA